VRAEEKPDAGRRKGPSNNGNACDQRDTFFLLPNVETEGQSEAPEKKEPGHSDLLRHPARGKRA